MTLPYPPPFMDLATLAEHICCGESTIEKWVKEGILPEPRKVGGKRLWRWKEVEQHLALNPKVTPISEVERIREATRAAANKAH
jgi:hypothetical protein